MPEHADSAVVLIHRIVGYPLAFIVAPLALLSFAGRPGHRRWGYAYAGAMTFLYISGTALTLTRHPWGTWEFTRNVAFNLLGFAMLFFALRAIWLMTRPASPRPAVVDRALLALLAALAATLVPLALVRSGPLRGIALAAIWLLVLELRDWRRGFAPAVLYRRHLRYMLASYAYVLTVASLVHLRDELSSDMRWLWPSVIFAVLIWLAGAAPLDEVRRRSAVRTRRAIAGALAVGLLFGVYIGWELVRGARISPQQEPSRAAATR